MISFCSKVGAVLISSYSKVMRHIANDPIRIFFTSSLSVSVAAHIWFQVLVFSCYTIFLSGGNCLMALSNVALSTSSQPDNAYSIKNRLPLTPFLTFVTTSSGINSNKHLFSVYFGGCFRSLAPLTTWIECISWTCFAISLKYSDGAPHRGHV